LRVAAPFFAAAERSAFVLVATLSSSRWSSLTGLAYPSAVDRKRG
jgi:hypothetical protein